MKRLVRIIVALLYISNDYILVRIIVALLYVSNDYSAYIIQVIKTSFDWKAKDVSKYVCLFYQRHQSQDSEKLLLLMSFRY